MTDSSFIAVIEQWLFKPATKALDNIVQLFNEKDIFTTR